MSKERARRDWLIPIPEGDVPTGFRCVQVLIPDSDAYARQLVGLIARAASWVSYEREAAHKAAEVANAWRAALIEANTLQECTLQTKLRVDDICTLSWSYDDWATFDSFDPSACISANIDSVVPGMIQQAILDAIADGLLQQGGNQPSGQNPPASGSCKTWHVVLRGNDRWKLPDFVNTGDTVEVTNAVGGWTDGAAFWYCWDGKDYILGACGSDQPYQSTDPLHSGNHMMIVGAYNTTTPVYFDARTSYTIPAGVNNQELWLQANDGQLYDNQGTIEFDVTHCVGGWIKVFDFAVNNGGFAALVSGGHTYGTYLAGTGWQASTFSFGGGTHVVCDIGRAFGITTHITYVGFTLVVNGLDPNGNQKSAYATGWAGIGDNISATGLQSYGHYIAQNLSNIRLSCDQYFGSITAAVITSCTLMGNGTQPTW